MTSAPIRLVIVDDVVAVRGALSRMLDHEEDIDVISTASNGEEAIALARNLRPDIILLDIEMPHMDGLTALPLILEASPQTRVIILAAQTPHHAETSVRALELGASDVLKKMDNADCKEAFSRELLAHIRAIAKGGRHQTQPAIDVHPQAWCYPASRPRAVAFAASTGGPQCLHHILRDLDGLLDDVPIFITQHMPATFTTVLAQHLSAISSRPVVEAYHGQIVHPGYAYLAPGDYHMGIHAGTPHHSIALNKGPKLHYCRPAADPMITSLTEHYGSDLLLVVLSGMGQDGLHGAQVLRNAGGSIIIQDRQSSAVWGMPGMVQEAGLSLAALSCAGIAEYLSKVCSTS